MLPARLRQQGIAVPQSGTTSERDLSLEDLVREKERLEDLIAEREEDFARGFTEDLIEYALGRPFGFTDADLANEILVASKDKQYSVSEFIHALVQSKPFQSK